MKWLLEMIPRTGVAQSSPPDTFVREVVGPSTVVGSFELVQNSPTDGAYLEVIAPSNDSVDNVQSPASYGVAYEVAAPNDAVGSTDEVVDNSARDISAIGVVAASDAVGHANKIDGVSLEVVVPKGAVGSADGVMQGAAPGAMHPIVQHKRMLQTTESSSLRLTGSNQFMMWSLSRRCWQHATL